MRRIESRAIPTIHASRQRQARVLVASSLLLVGGALLILGVEAFAADGKTKGAVSAHADLDQKGNGSGVSMDAKTAKSIPVGVASPLSLDFGPARVEGAVARVRVPDGVTVTLADGSPVGDIALAVGQPTRVDLLVTARNDGRQYLDVTTVQDARSSIRSVALPVGSNDVRLKAQGRVEIMPNGDRVKVMQAQ